VGEEEGTEEGEDSLPASVVFVCGRSPERPTTIKMT